MTSLVAIVDYACVSARVRTGIKAMNYGRCGLGAVLFVAVATASAARAQITSDSMVQGRAARQVDINAQGRVEYDSNVARTSKSAAAARGLVVDDIVYSPGVYATIVQPIGQQAVFLNGRVSYLFHDKNTRLDTSRVNATAGAGGRLGPCGAVVSGTYARGRSELDDTTLSEAVENILSLKRVNVGATCIRPGGLGLTLGASRDWADNSLARLEASDYETIGASAGLIYSRPATGSIGLLANYAMTEYRDRPTLSGRTSGYELVAGGVQVERRLGARIQGKASLSYSHVELLDPIILVPGGTSVVSDFDGLTYSANLTFRASSRLRISGNFQRAISPTLVSQQAFEVQTDYEANVDYRLGSRISVSGGIAQKDSNTRGLLTPGVIVTDSRTRSYLGSIRYRQSDRLSFVLSAAHQRRETDNPLLDYSSDRIGISTDVSF